MHHVLFVRIIQRVGNPRDDAYHLVQRQQMAGPGVSPHVFTFKKLHRDIGQIMFFARVIDRHDVGVVEAARSLRFAEEALLRIFQLVGLKLL